MVPSIVNSCILMMQGPSPVRVVWLVSGVRVRDFSSVKRTRFGPLRECTAARHIGSPIKFADLCGEEFE